jgi:hypothetical protein
VRVSSQAAQQQAYAVSPLQAPHALQPMEVALVREGKAIEPSPIPSWSWKYAHWEWANAKGSELACKQTGERHHGMKERRTF